MSDRVEIIVGNIAGMEVDAIVNAANNSLLGGAGVDGAIHAAAGRELFMECMKLDGCATGEAKITGGHNLNAKWIIHTVGPIWKNGGRREDEKLANCYRNCLALAAEHAIESIAFPAISTGAYGFPVERASQIAMKETLHFLSGNETVRKVIFVCFDAESFEIYQKVRESLKA